MGSTSDRRKHKALLGDSNESENLAQAQELQIDVSNLTKLYTKLVPIALPFRRTLSLSLWTVFAVVVELLRLRPHHHSIALKAIITLLNRSVSSTMRLLDHKPVLNYDCMCIIFDKMGFKRATMAAVARVFGFNDGSREALLRLRASPLRLLSPLTACPEDLLAVMHDCHTLLFGSQAVGLFWPDAVTKTSGWDFATHPTFRHWFRFALYMSSIGVTWHTEVSKQINRKIILSGTLERAGRIHKINLFAHAASLVECSSLELVMKSPISIVQCYVTGFAAVAMDRWRTPSGKVVLWQQKKADVNQAQELANKYIDRGARCIHYSSEPALVPSPKERHAMDNKAIFVPLYEYYSDPERQARVCFDSQRMQNIRWIEDLTGTHLKPDDRDTLIEEALASEGMSKPMLVPLYDMVTKAVHCGCCWQVPCTSHRLDPKLLTLVRFWNDHLNRGFDLANVDYAFI
ncbi:hypothetical protein M433DRAFT_548600 [Acidomyces richmondensis BFW]|nr:hypothetical protein M433DRAFT_548600 [Acidomyces richmondensis BFW]